MEDSSLPQTKYSASVWELIGIVTGALVLIGIGLTGLAFKAWSNAFNPQRAEAIARSIVDYEIPNGSRGQFGANVGSVRLALVASNTSPPDVQLLIGRVPIGEQSDAEPSEENFNEVNGGVDGSEENFKVISTRVEDRNFCSMTVPVTIQEGEQTFSDPTATVPAVKYSANATFRNTKRVVVLTANGRDAKANALKIFNSLKCK